MKWRSLDGSTHDIISLTQSSKHRHQFWHASLWHTQCLHIVVTFVAKIWHSYSLLSSNQSYLKTSYINPGSLLGRSHQVEGPQTLSRLRASELRTLAWWKGWASDYTFWRRRSWVGLCWDGSNVVSGSVPSPMSLGYFFHVDRRGSWYHVRWGVTTCHCSWYHVWRWPQFVHKPNTENAIFQIERKRA